MNLAALLATPNCVRIHKNIPGAEAVTKCTFDILSDTFTSVCLAKQNYGL
jgi:hypothetical protein